VGDAVGDGHLRHLDGVFERAGAVIQARKDVAVYINHFPVPAGKIPEPMVLDNR
jgi:hypothetical protein